MESGLGLIRFHPPGAAGGCLSPGTGCELCHQNAFPDFTLRSEWSHFPPTDALGARICYPLPIFSVHTLDGFGVPKTQGEAMVLTLFYAPKEMGRVWCGT